jgi:hypothetical protein
MGGSVQSAIDFMANLGFVSAGLKSSVLPKQPLKGAHHEQGSS